MKSSDFNTEIRQLSVEELREKARSIAEELMKLRFRRASGQLEQTHLLGELRRNLARVRTLLLSKQRSSDSASAGA